jgi:hypothetical protein
MIKLTRTAGDRAVQVRIRVRIAKDFRGRALQLYIGACAIFVDERQKSGCCKGSRSHPRTANFRIPACELAKSLVEVIMNALRMCLTPLDDPTV